MFRKFIVKSYNWLFFLALSTTSSFAGKNLVEKDTSFDYTIKVYFIGWDVLARSRLTPDDIRDRRDIYLEIKKQRVVFELKQNVDNLNCENIDKNLFGDIRFVLDVENDGLIIESLYANNDILYKEKNRDVAFCGSPEKFFELLDLFK